MYCANMKMRSDILIHDGFWADDLNSLANKILFWHRKSNRLLLQYGWGDDQFQRAQHHLAKYIFISASIVRKIVEEEFEFIDVINRYNDDFPGEPPITNKYLIVHTYQLKTSRFLLKKSSKDLYFQDFCIDDYDPTTIKKCNYSIKDISNWIIHSYVWWLGDLEQKNLITGFFISSDYDKAKHENFISIEEWVDAVKYCAQNASL